MGGTAAQTEGRPELTARVAGAREGAAYAEEGWLQPWQLQLMPVLALSLAILHVETTDIHDDVGASRRFNRRLHLQG